LQQAVCRAPTNRYINSLAQRVALPANGDQLTMTLRRLLAAATLALAGTLAVLPTADAQRAGDIYGGFPRGQNPYSAGKQKAPSQAGQFDYYLLSLSWSPSYCAGLPRDGYDPQCNRRDGKRYAFILHGLWPQYERGWPQDCQTADRGFVPAPVADRMLDIMPSKKLVFHEYRKHGTCSGLGIDGYFDLSRKLYEKVKIPDRFRNLTDPRFTVSPTELINEVVAINPGMKPDNLAVECGGPGNRLKELRVCFDKQGEFRACGRNENQSKLCSAPSMYVPPVREGGQPASSSSPTLKERIQRYIPGSGQRI
jgi:ribonuclease T2